MSVLNNKFTRPPIIRHFVLIVWLVIALPLTPFFEVTIQEIIKTFYKYFFKWRVENE